MTGIRSCLLWGSVSVMLEVYHEVYLLLSLVLTCVLSHREYVGVVALGCQTPLLSLLEVLGA